MTSSPDPKGATADEYEERPVNPRWIDWHFPDGRIARWLVRHLPNGRLRRTADRYSLRFVHCPLDGQCIFRAGHRGSCCWGDDGEDD